MNSQTQTAKEEFEPRFALQYEIADDDKELKEALCKTVSGRFFDALTVTFRGKSDALGLKTERGNGTSQTDNFALTITIQTNFFSHETGVFCRHGERVISLEIAEVMQNKGTDWIEWRAWLDESNRKLGLMPPPDDVAEVARRAAKPIEAPTLKSADYNFHTGQESDCLIRAASEGARKDSFRRDTQRRALVYEQSSGSHRVELCQDSHDDGGELLEMGALEWLATQQSADFGFTFFYVCRQIAPPAPLPSNRAAVGWIDLDDVAAKIGYDVDGCTADKREELRAQIWQFLLFGARALVIGQRKTYRDRATGKEIETRVETPPWRVLDKERPIQTAMWGETPRRVQLLISKEWEPLLSAPALAQYLPFAEIVGTLPAGQTAGAWARVLGMALAGFWRRLPHEATGAAAPILPTRRELLTRYTPRANKQGTNTPLEMLNSNDPKRAVKCWRNSLAMLRERGFIAPDGEAARNVAQMLESLPKYKWQEAWLDERVDLRPGAAELDALAKVASAKHKAKPRALSAAKRKPRRSKTAAPS